VSCVCPVLSCPPPINNSLIQVQSSLMPDISSNNGQYDLRKDLQPDPRSQVHEVIFRRHYKTDISIVLCTEKGVSTHFCFTLNVNDTLGLCCTGMASHPKLAFCGKEQPYSTAKLVFHSGYCILCRWKEHIMKITNVLSSGDETLQKVNVTGLLISLVAAGVLLVIIALLIFYCCKSRCKSRQPQR